MYSGRTVALRPAIEVRWTIDLEREIDCRKQRIDPIGWQRILRILHQAQRVNRKVAVLIYGDMQGFGIGGVDLCLNGDDVANALTALDLDVRGGQRVRSQIVDEINNEFLLAVRRIGQFDFMVEDFKVVDAAEIASGELVAPDWIAAEIDHADGPPCANSAVWRTCVRRTMN